MATRPKVVILISVWMWIVTSITWSWSIRFLHLEALKEIHPGVGGLIGIAIGIGLFQMRPFARNFARVVLALASILFMWMMIMGMRANLPQPVRFYSALISYELITLWSLLYISRQRFAAACKQFRAERMSRLDKNRALKGTDSGETLSP